MAANLKLSDIPVVNFGRFILDNMKQYGDKVALVNAETGGSYTYNQAIDMTERLAAGLQHIGVRKGDVVCICSTNNVDYMIAVYATILIGATVQPVNPTYTKDDLIRATRACKTKYIFTTPELLEKVSQAARGTAIKVITFGEATGYTSFQSLLKISKRRFEPVACDPKNDIAALMSSSGTTGFPKSVMLPHYALVSTSFLLKSVGVVTENTAVVLMLPMYHVYGLSVLTSTAHAMGANVVVMARFTPDAYLELIQKYRPQQLNVIPFVMVMLAKYPKVSQYDLSSVEKITCGAAPLSQEIEEVCRKRLNLRNVDQGYGMTEIGVSHANTDVAFRNKSVGKLVPLTEMKIVDVEKFQPVKQGDQGEIWIRSPQVCKGYLNLPEATAEMFLPDGWVRTGDLGVEDKDGFLYIVGRLKELIKYKGLQVAPASLEDILLTHAAVADCGVIGLPDERAGELPKAFVVKKAGFSVTDKELISYVAGKVAPHMQLRGGVEFIDEIPRTLSGKILRRVLQARTNNSSKL